VHSLRGKRTPREGAGQHPGSLLHTWAKYPPTHRHRQESTDLPKIKSSGGAKRVDPSSMSGSERTEVSEEANKAVIRRWIKAYNERDMQAEADVLAPGYVAYVLATDVGHLRSL
jgi:hypothetical protein